MSRTAKACPSCGHPQAKATSLFTWVFGGLFTVFVVSMCVISPEMAREDKEATAMQTAQVAAQQEAAEVVACRTERAAKVAAYDALILEGKFWSAARAVGRCGDLLKDGDLKARVIAAETKEYRAVALDKKQTAKARAEAIEAMQKYYPSQAVELLPLLSSMQAQAADQDETDRKKTRREDLARRKKAGVTLGMSQEEVIQSVWGKPQKINRSTYTFGVHEQWVYGGGYLYFEDGVLKSIQN